MLGFQALLVSGVAAATHVLYAADYSGQVTSLSYTLGGSFLETSANQGCAPNPSWVTLDIDTNILYCMGEGLSTPNGSLSSFHANEEDNDAQLYLVQNITTLDGPVNGQIYGSDPSGTRAIALAHYASSAVSSWLINSQGDITFLENIQFSLDQPGPDPSRQDAPHPHQVIVDPTGQYVLVPDLGADLVRVFSYDNTTFLLNTLTPLNAAAGSGPRHGAFWTPDSSEETYFYIVAELAGTVTGYSVTYIPDCGGLEFTQVYESPTFGTKPQPVGTAPAEIQIAPDNTHLIISNRGDNSFNVTLDNGTSIPSDTLSNFVLNSDGTLDLLQLAPAGGSFPRQFSLNAAGDFLAVGLQNNNQAVILQRNVTTGLIGEDLARAQFGGQTTCIVWAESPGP